MILSYEDFLFEKKIPKEYLSAPTDADKKRMKAEIKKHSKKSDDDETAYGKWPADYKKGDTLGKPHETKLSKATIAYNKKFKKNENFSNYEDFINENETPEWKDSDAPDAEGRFKKLGIRKLAAWLIRSRKRDLKKISGSITQQIVFNRGKDPQYADKMEKVRKEVYRQLGREDLLKEEEVFEKEAWKTALQNKEEETGIPYRFLKKVYDKGLAAWKTGHRPGVAQHQWAMGRVNSWITGEGKARKVDIDIWDEYKEWEKTNESKIEFPHEVKNSENFWKKIIESIPQVAKRNYVSKIFDTIMKKQEGFASDRQMEILRRAQRGDSSPYHTKN